MSIKIHIVPPIYSHANDTVTTEVDGDTVGQCFDYLIKQFPGIEKDLFGEDGVLHGHINILVNKKNAYPEDLDKLINDGDEIYVVSILGGG